MGSELDHRSNQDRRCDQQGLRMTTPRSASLEGLDLLSLGLISERDLDCTNGLSPSILRFTCLLNRAEEAREAVHPLGGLPMRSLIVRIGTVELVTPDRHVPGAMGSQG